MSTLPSHVFLYDTQYIHAEEDAQTSPHASEISLDVFFIYAYTAGLLNRARNEDVLVVSDVDISRRTGLSPRGCEVSADSVRYLYVAYCWRRAAHGRAENPTVR